MTHAHVSNRLRRLVACVRHHRAPRTSQVAYSQDFPWKDGASPSTTEFEDYLAEHVVQVGPQVSREGRPSAWATHGWRWRLALLAPLKSQAAAAGRGIE
jgi:hypothetical protein